MVCTGVSQLEEALFDSAGFLCGVCTLGLGRLIGDSKFSRRCECLSVSVRPVIGMLQWPHRHLQTLTKFN